MQFKNDANVDTNGTSFQNRIGSITPKRMVASFGPCNQESYEEEKGYHDGEWYFSDEKGAPYTVYFRYGECHVGAHHESKDRVPVFIGWLLTHVK